MCDKSAILTAINQVDENEFKTYFNDHNVDVKYSSDLYLLSESRTAEKCEDNELQVQSNGIILEKGTNVVVCMSQNKMKEIDTLAGLQIADDTTMEYAEDGTVMRLYNYKGKWHTATTRTINAEYSYWTSEKSFADLFWETFDVQLLETMDPTCTYIFVLLHTENRIVVKHVENVLVFISKISNVDYTQDTNNPFVNVFGIRSTLKFPNTHDPVYYPNKRGVIVKTPTQVYKYDFSEYTEIKQVRGNVPHIKYRYLELLKDTDLLLKLIENYKEHYFMFAVINHSLNRVINNVFKLYKDSHIKHKIRIDESHMYYRTLKQIHATYKNTGKNITIEDVQEKIYSLDKSVLKKFLGWV
ncbi:hypothetical protein EB118_15430 [bacterium]|nr:hypothetical protein [bacterium]NDD83667.1 hypothetical protein [bacterium]NDG31445.1 hypothetical protein [bacterium]